MPDRDEEIEKELTEVSKNQDRLVKFNELHARIWKDISFDGLPLPYRELVNNLMNQTSLTVLNTMENIELLREEVRSGDGRFSPSDQVVAFCKSMVTLSPVMGAPGSIQSTMWHVAHGDTLLEEDYTNLKKISESLARSQTTTEKVTPFKTSWGQD